jgi:hypothetical protein
MSIPLSLFAFSLSLYRQQQQENHPKLFDNSRFTNRLIIRDEIEPWVVDGVPELPSLA